MKRYQILTRPCRKAPWRFLAHGAVYTDDEGVDIETIIRNKGEMTRRIPV